MGRGYFTEEEIAQLKMNPYVSDVDEKRVIYTNEFKNIFVDEYNRGKKPSKIFKDHGFDVKVLGSKRIERASARWRESYKAGVLGSRNYTMKTRTETINALRAENSLLKSLCEKMVEQGNKPPEIREVCTTIRQITDNEEYSQCLPQLCSAVGITEKAYMKEIAKR